MNKVILVGRLTRDPNVSYSGQDQSMAVARFTLAVDRKIKRDASNEQSADFISCVAFNKAGEFAEKYLRKGTKVVLEGHILTGSYTNKEGKAVFTTDVVADQLEFAESKAASRQAEATPAETDKDGFMQIPDDVSDEGLPFN